MKRRHSIFDSKAERDVFRQIESRWKAKLRIYPQLPLAKLLSFEPVDKLRPNEVRFFYATNVDYTFADPSDRPLFSVEFDGIGRGYSRDGEYVALRETEDPNRAWKMGFKLRAAERASYPLIVISVEAVDALWGDDTLTILDEIIGQFLAKREFPVVAQELLDGERQRFPAPETDHPLPDEQDLLLQAEVLAELDNDPLARKASELQGELFLEVGEFGISQQWLTDPDHPAGNPDEILKALSAGARVGCRVVIELRDSSVPAVIQTTWVRNFDGAGITPSTVATNVAEYLALKNAVRIVRAGKAPAPERS